MDQTHFALREGVVVHVLVPVVHGRGNAEHFVLSLLGDFRQRVALACGNIHFQTFVQEWIAVIDMIEEYVFRILIIVVDNRVADGKGVFRDFVTAFEE